MPQKKDYYGILEVSRDASQEDIKKAYRVLVKKWHPDRHLENKKVAEEKFKEVQEAYEVLSNPEKRKLYDRFGFVPEGGMPNGGNGSYTGGVEDIFKDFFGGGSGNFGDAGGPFSDFFDMFFGNERGGSSRGTRTQRASKGQDIHATVTLELEELLYDVEKVIEYSRYENCTSCNGTGAEGGTAFSTCPRCNGRGQIAEEQRTFFGTFVKNYTCPTCNGQGKIISKKCSVCDGSGKNYKKERLSVKIPAGIEDGYVLKITGKGNNGLNGGPNGDLIVHIKVINNPKFRRNGADLETEIKVDYITAALGGTIKIPTLEGDITEKISEGTNPGTIIRLKNLGLPNFTGKKRGDIYVKLNVEINKPSMREKKYLKEIAKIKKLDI
ncbi:molecular chaperone DnaJ [Oceanotoga sp. DSM 15011]|uniref:molecular chaperone DnaJ n=1 Tax=Oceanotoga sp. DSM 15011 TaxID=2984951 RepID=UPI0021F3F0B5|nr:molecular chaperone DnaJ [Oceanotoga sp. DSM 15011]UYP01081.1 molecular chaperone DnaJ [Oceanotoga sp. DSM 15011]